MSASEPAVYSAPEHRAARLRAQERAFREFHLAKPPAEPRKLELWLQNAAGFLIFEKVRAAALATLEESVSAETKQAVQLAVDAAIYSLMMQIDGVSGGLGSWDLELELTFGVELTEDGRAVASMDLREGDGMCMGFHSWLEGDFGGTPLVDEPDLGRAP
jgi:hypothetical protein